MGLIRSVCRPANAGLSLRFQRCQDTKISSAYLHPVLNKTSNHVHTSNILCNDRSYAASAASSALEDRKPQKRVSKSERRTMVENYVNNLLMRIKGIKTVKSDMEFNRAFNLANLSMQSNLFRWSFHCKNLAHGSSIPFSIASSRDSIYVDGMKRLYPAERAAVEYPRNEDHIYIVSYAFCPPWYREKTEGKFPSPSDTMKDVGGSYYVVRQILQEMIYNSKQSSMACKDTSLDKSTRKKNEMIYNSKESEDIKDISLEKSAIKNHEMVSNAKEQSMYTNDTSLEKSTMEEDRRSTKFEEVPQSRELDKGTRPIVKDIEISSSMIFQSKEGQEPSVSNETDEPKDIGAQSHHPIDKLESSQNLDYEKDVRQEILEDHVKSDALECKARGQESMEISGRGSQQMPSEEAEAQQKSSVWNNLKSFANGIFSLWKRS